MPSPTPCGSWPSPISAHMLAEKSIGIGGVGLDGDDLYWLEMRPADGGRYVLVRRDASGHIADVTAAPFNVRTRVHEYGGGAYTVANGVVWFSNIGDGRIHRIDPGAPPRAITPEGVDMRYADMVYDASRDLLWCVREDHVHLAVGSDGARDPEAQNTIVAIPADGDGTAAARVVVQGADFYAAPRISPDGRRLCWQSWNHPNMPWDGCELWVADVDKDAAVSNARRVAGGKRESIVQPCWSPDGVLYFVSDRSGWWNIHRATDGGGTEALTAEHAEFGEPQWVFGMSHYAFDGPQRIVAAYIVQGTWRLGSIDTTTKALTPIPLPYTAFSASIRVRDGHAYLVAASPTQGRALVEIHVDTASITVIRTAESVDLDPRWISPPETIEFPTEGGCTAYAFFYAPRNPDHTVPPDELPPLLVRTHGGPTSITPAYLQLDTQYWTTRGFAVCDVNYGGSSGYGREYRDRLDGNWGVVDVDDSVNVAKHLVNAGRVDPNRLAIDGGSAGGYTTLAVLTFRDTYQTGASYFGVSELALLARYTHKFESRYLDGLVAPYPQRKDVYEERSPIDHVDKLRRPMILFQGLDDRVVPPDQAESMFAAVRAKGLPCAYVAFEGEDHGFRKADSIVRSIESELGFYAHVFDFAPAGELTPLQIENAAG